jgi:hypothetical protein
MKKYFFLFRGLRNLLLFLLEWSFKLFAPICGIITLGAPNSTFFGKLLSGLVKSYFQIWNFFFSIPNYIRMAIDSDSHKYTPREYLIKYGGTFEDIMLAKATMLKDAFYNASSPSVWESLLAGFLVTAIMLIFAWMIKFYRQKGKGNIIHRRIELPLGKKLFPKHHN